ncbi:MAG: SDR family oxidoreductase [Anaerolineales bacterium]|jgi:NAD(P)-dependent dehydrogenase (short-subunit alcohol dehydrogenase family)
MSLSGKTILITGAALRIGRSLALAVARAGGDVVLHYGKSQKEAESLKSEIEVAGRKAFILQADLADAAQVADLISRASEYTPLFGLVNNASVFEPIGWKDTSLDQWNQAMMVNLTAPFLLSQAFARSLGPGEHGRIVNMLDWRALRPGPDNLPYTISKSALASLTHSLAVALAPRITVNGLALGAILPPSNGAPTKVNLEQIPARRWANLEEVGQALIFLLDGPAYITGEIIHVDGGRHLV